MKVIITFREPYDITSPGLDGTVIAFPFVVTRIAPGAERDQVSEHRGLVSISGTLSSMWGFGRDDTVEAALVRTMFEHVRRQVRADVEAGTLLESFEIPLWTNTAPGENPFDPSKIPNPNGHTIEVDVAEPSREMYKRRQDVEQNITPPEIADSLSRFAMDYPSAARAAFIMMPFGSSATHEVIAQAIKDVLADFGIQGLRADDKDYHDDLFANVLTYVYGCSFGIAVFERIEDDYFNPNVSLEVGYMMGLRKPICLLKDKSLSTLQADLVSKLYKRFDTRNLPDSLRDPIEKWLRDRDLIPPREEIEGDGLVRSYHGPAQKVRDFVAEAHSFEVFVTTSVTYRDGVSEVSFDYSGDLPESFFDKLAAKHGLSEGKYRHS